MEEKRDTVELLQEISTGCHMAVSSFEQVQEFDIRHELLVALQKYEKSHREMEQEATDMLHELGEEEKRPGAMVSAMSWLTTEMKMNLKEDATQAAKLMMNGCNTGIQSIGEAIGKYPSASEKSVKLARKLIENEEKLMKEMEDYL